MPLETGTYISDLVSTNPAHTDSVGQADSHLRFVKSAILATFTAITGAVTATHTQLNTAVAAVVTGLAQAVHQAGSAGAPGVSFLGSLTSGLYSPATNQVAIAAGGVQCLLAKPDGSLSGGTGQLGIVGEPRLWLSNTLPAGTFAWLNGQAISRSANPLLFAMWGTTYGIGDGVTTFNIPNFQDVVPIGRGTMGGATDPVLGVAGARTTLGAIIGEGVHTLAVGELPAHTHSGTTGNENASHTHTVPLQPAGNGGYTGGTGNPVPYCAGGSLATSNEVGTHTHNFSTDNGTGGGAAHNNVQPSIVCNWIVLLG
jgi:microcystin-dependent protein